MFDDQSPTAVRDILRMENVTKTFVTRPVIGRAKTVEALRSVNLSIRSGGSLALVGESGSGKSTVGLLITRTHSPTSGQINVDGTDIEAHKTRDDVLAYRKTVQMVFQDPFSALNPAHTVRRQLQRALRLHQPDQSDERALKELLEAVELDPGKTLDKYPHELSGGQRQRVNIARTIAVNARLIIADEPTSMLDVSIRKSVLKLMRRLKQDRGLSLLYITHDIATASYLADETAVMFRGQVLEQGPTDLVVGNPRHEYTKLLCSAVPDPRKPLVAIDDGFADWAERVRGESDRPVSGMSEVSENHFVAQH